MSAWALVFQFQKPKLLRNVRFFAFNSFNLSINGRNVRLLLFAFTVARWDRIKREQSVTVLHPLSTTGPPGNGAAAKYLSRSAMSGVQSCLNVLSCFLRISALFTCKMLSFVRFFRFYQVLNSNL